MSWGLPVLTAFGGVLSLGWRPCARALCDTGFLNNTLLDQRPGEALWHRGDSRSGGRGKPGGQGQRGAPARAIYSIWEWGCRSTQPWLWSLVLACWP